MNSRFAEHTRSATFALTLSEPMIRTMFVLDTEARLCEKYPWHHTGFNFGTLSSWVAQQCNGTIRSLIRKGLVEVADFAEQTYPQQVGEDLYDGKTRAEFKGSPNRTDIIRLTSAGRAMIAVLSEAGFEVNPDDIRKVGLHPDDRDKLHINVGATAPTFERIEGDRRDPDDAAFFSVPHKSTMNRSAAEAMTDGTAVVEPRLLDADARIARFASLDGPPYGW